jgi:hypothetical protein
MTLILADLISSIRYELNDFKTSHFQRFETPIGTVNGTNKTFYVRYFPLAGAVINTDVFLTVDGVLLSAGYTIDVNSGTLTLTTAPVTSIVVNYYFYVFTDPEITDWVKDGIEHCGFLYNDLAKVPDGLSPAVKYFALHHGCNAFARKWAEGFNWTFGQETVDKDKISAKYKTLAETYWKEAIDMRADYYKHFGARDLPAFQIKAIPQVKYDVTR